MHAFITKKNIVSTDTTFMNNEHYVNLNNQVYHVLYNKACHFFADVYLKQTSITIIYFPIINL